MPQAKYTGSPMGSGNPPGKYSESYLDNVDSPDHFNRNKEYRGDMHVGINESSKIVGNQPSENKQSDAVIDSRKNEALP